MLITWVSTSLPVKPLGRTAEAMRVLDQGMAKDPRNGDILKLRGDFLVQMKQYGRAVEAYDSALKYWPGMVEAQKCRLAAIKLLEEEKASENSARRTGKNAKPVDKKFSVR